MHPLYRESNIMQDIQCDEVKSEGEDEEDMTGNNGDSHFGLQEKNNKML